MLSLAKHSRFRTPWWFLSLLLCQLGSAQNTYYVDAANGSDSNQGTSVDLPWKSISKVNSYPFVPGDVVSFKSGSVWKGPLNVTRSGNEKNPITFRAYGSGSKPTIKNPSGGQWGDAVAISGNWIIMDGLATDSSGYGGFHIQALGAHDIIRNCDVVNAGIGIPIHGRYNLVTNNHIHSLHHMVVNTVGGDDDYGAVGVWFFNSHNEVSYNQIDSCYAPCFDYGEDGGAIEFYGKVDSCYIHHNWVFNTDGFCEIGGGPETGGWSAIDCNFSYNVYINVRGQPMLWLHLHDYFASTIRNLRFENNTVLCLNPNKQGWVLVGWDSVPSPETFVMQNNIIYLDNWQAVVRTGGFTHGHNLFFCPSSPVILGCSLGTGDLVGNPQFVDAARLNVRLKTTSPAVKAGLSLGYHLDFDNHQLPVNVPPDIGAFEMATSTNTGQPRGNPTTALLSQNFPNPFNPTTVIQYYLPSSSFVRIELYDILGRLQKTLVNEKKDAGSYEFVLSAHGLASGIYVYRMQAGQYVASCKCVVLN